MCHKVSTDSYLAQAKDPESWGQPGLQCHCHLIIRDPEAWTALCD